MTASSTISCREINGCRVFTTGLGLIDLPHSAVDGTSPNLEVSPPLPRISGADRLSALCSHGITGGAARSLEHASISRKHLTAALKSCGLNTKQVTSFTAIQYSSASMGLQTLAPSLEYGLTSPTNLLLRCFTCDPLHDSLTYA